MTLDEWKEKFPKGTKVKTSFYSKEKDKVRLVKEVRFTSMPSQSNGIFLTTVCGVNADIAWFERIGE